MRMRSSLICMITRAAILRRFLSSHPISLSLWLTGTAHETTPRSHPERNLLFQAAYRRLLPPRRSFRNGHSRDKVDQSIWESGLGGHRRCAGREGQFCICTGGGGEAGAKQRALINVICAAKLLLFWDASERARPCPACCVISLCCEFFPRSVEAPTL